MGLFGGQPTRATLVDLSSAIFIDVEASGFAADGGYPIEVGWADLSGQASSLLIRPMDHWTFWSGEAEKLHGISRSMLFEKGIAPDQAARQLATVVTGRIVHSDNPAHDSWWIARLFLDAGFALPAALTKLQDTKQLVTLLSQRRRLSYIDAMEIELEVKKLAPFRHRAADDAAHWATITRLTAERGAGPQA